MTRVLALCCAAITIIAACARHPDADPQPVHPDTPRIVALSPAVAITLRDMGYEPWIVGRHGWDLALDPALPVCGDQLGIDYEALVRAAPTHVFVQWGSRDLPGRLSTLADERGWRVHDEQLLTLDEVVAFAPLARDLLGEPPASGRTAEEIRAALEPSPVVADARVSILLLIPGDEPAALGPGSAHHDLLVRLGGRSALAPDAGAYARLHAEDLVALGPDAIVVFDPGARGSTPSDPLDTARAIESLGWIADLRLPAVERGRVALIDDPLCLTPSTALVGVADALARAIEAWETDSDK